MEGGQGRNGGGDGFCGSVDGNADAMRAFLAKVVASSSCIVEVEEGSWFELELL